MDYCNNNLSSASPGLIRSIQDDQGNNTRGNTEVDDHQRSINFQMGPSYNNPPYLPPHHLPCDPSSLNHPSPYHQGVLYHQHQHHHQPIINESDHQLFPFVLSSDYACSSPIVLPLVADHHHQGGGALPTIPPSCSSLMGVFFDPGKQNINNVENSPRAFCRPVQMPRWDSSVTRAARSKRRMARQMSTSSSSSRQMNTTSSSSSSSPSSLSSVRTPATQNDIYSYTASDGKKLRFILEKQLKNSDVNTLGRIILPKKPSEANLPSLAVKEGIQVTVREMGSSRTWYMRYRFWPNNKSRMYVMENTGDYVRLNELNSGDFIMLYHDEENQLYISCKKAERPSSVPSPEEELLKQETEDLTAPLVYQNIEETQASDPPEKMPPPLPTADHDQNMVMEEDHVMGMGDSIFINCNDYDFSDLENLPNFDDCDLSLYDDLIKSICGDKGSVDDESGGDSTVVSK